MRLLLVIMLAWLIVLTSSFAWLGNRIKGHYQLMMTWLEESNTRNFIKNNGIEYVVFDMIGYPNPLDKYMMYQASYIKLSELDTWLDQNRINAIVEKQIQKDKISGIWRGDYEESYKR